MMTILGLPRPLSDRFNSNTPGITWCHMSPNQRRSVLPQHLHLPPHLRPLQKRRKENLHNPSLQILESRSTRVHYAYLHKWFLLQCLLHVMLTCQCYSSSQKNHWQIINNHIPEVDMSESSRASQIVVFSRSSKTIPRNLAVDLCIAMLSSCQIYPKGCCLRVSSILNLPKLLTWRSMSSGDPVLHKEFSPLLRHGEWPCPKSHWGKVVGRFARFGFPGYFLMGFSPIQNFGS